MLHQGACSPEVVLAKIAESGDLVDAEFVVTHGLLTGGSLVPVNGKQAGSTAEVLGNLIGALKIAKTLELRSFRS